MRLTDEERRIADDVARHWAYTLHQLDDAWARALAYIAARRKALGDAGPDLRTAADVIAEGGDKPVVAPVAMKTEDEARSVSERIGDTAESVVRAYEVIGPGTPVVFHAANKHMAEKNAREFGGRIVPLVRADYAMQDALAAFDRLHRAALRLYGHAWSCDTLTPVEQAEAWAALRDALCLPPGTATAAGVGGDEPRAEAVGDATGPANQSPPTFEGELADLINRHGIDSQHNTPDSVLSRFVMRVLEAHSLAAERRSAEPPPVVAAPRGVVVTPGQRDAVEWAAGYIEATIPALLSAKNKDHHVKELSSLLDAIDAAKGGVT